MPVAINGISQSTTVSTNGGGGGRGGPYSGQIDAAQRVAHLEALMRMPVAPDWVQADLHNMLSQQERQNAGINKKLPNGVTPMEMIRLRMHIPEREVIPFPHIHAIVHEDTVVVFVVTGSGETVTLKDELLMFPTDSLIAKLNLLRP
jgi:hypothetical protein